MKRLLILVVFVAFMAGCTKVPFNIKDVTVTQVASGVTTTTHTLTAVGEYDTYFQNKNLSYSPRPGGAAGMGTLNFSNSNDPTLKALELVAPLISGATAAAK
jgi:hypothetical protein